MNIAYSMTVTEKTTGLIEDENAESLYTIGWFSVSNDPVITSENAYNGKSQTKGTCVFVSSLWTLMLIVMFEEYSDDVSFKF